MPLPRPSSPKALWNDLRAFTAARTGVQWGAMLLAVMMPLTFIAGFIIDANTNIAPGEQLTYVTSWDENRSDEEIIAAQKERQIKREAAELERQRQFKRLEDRLGM